MAFVCIFREVEPIREGKEPNAFWEAIGGYEEYATGKRMEVTEINQQREEIFLKPLLVYSTLR